jgi:hypothetical protein
MKTLRAKHAAASVVCLLLLTAGCGSDSSRTLVEGKVTYKGQTVGEQTLVLHSQGNQGEFFTHKIPISADGTFSSQGPAPGTYKVVIEQSLAAQEGVKPAGGKAAAVPQKYRLVESTDLTWDIHAGENKKDIELTDSR